MAPVVGIDLGTTYSCIAYIDDSEKPVVLKNAEGDLTTPSVVYFESPTEITVGSAAKEVANLYPDQVVDSIKRHIGQSGFKLTINGQDMKPEEISAYILKKVVGDAEDSLRMENKLGDDEHITKAVITCPAYFGVAEREATKAAGELAGLEVLSIINEPTAAAITYGVTDDKVSKTVLVYDLGGGTFDITMIKIDPGEIRVVCTGGDKDLGGKDWDERVVAYLAEQYKERSGSDDEILENPETLQDLSLSAEKVKKLLTAKEKAPVAVNYNGERVRVVLTREKFDELTDDLLSRTIDMTKDIFAEAEKKGIHQSDVSEILLVGGSSKMPQVANRVKAEFGIETKMFDPDEAVAKGAAIFAGQMNDYHIVIDQIAQATGKTAEEVKEQIDSGETTVEAAAKQANVSVAGRRLPGGSVSSQLRIINVSSRSFGLITLDANEKEYLENIILRNQELPAEATETFYPQYDNQTSVRLQIKECLSSDKNVDVSLGQDVGEAELKLPANTPSSTPIEITFRLDDSGLLHVHAKEGLGGGIIDADFQTKDAMSDQEKSEALRRASNTTVS